MEDIHEKLIADKLKTQDKINKAFTNAPLIRIEEQMTFEGKLIQKELPTHTEVIELEGDGLELRRFINRKLYKVKFIKGMTAKELVTWLNCDDELFVKVAR